MSNKINYKLKKTFWYYLFLAYAKVGSVVAPNSRTPKWMNYEKMFKLKFYGIAFLMIAICATSCHTVKQACTTLDKHPKDAAGYCAAKFPVKPFTKTILKTVKGKPDTVTVAGETVYADCSDAVTAALSEEAKSHVPVKCPDTKVITVTDTVYSHDTTVVENTAVSEGLHYSLTDTTEKLTKAEQSVRDWRGRALWTWGVLVLLLGLRFGYGFLKNQYVKKAASVAKDLA